MAKIRSVDRFNDFMQKNHGLAFLFGMFLCVVIAVIDHAIGPELNLFILYLVPALWVTWVIGRYAGYAIAIAVMIGELVFKLSGHVFANNTLIVWEIIMRTCFVAVNVYVLAKLKEAINRAKETARMDYLTGVANSKAFFEMTQIEIYRCRRHKKPLSLAFIDCDNFKEVNDRFGHPKGDEFLRQFATTLKKGLRATDILARVGGDEFAVVLPEANAQDANAIFVRLRNSLDDAMRAHGFIVTMSVGVASFSSPPEEVKDLIAQADKFMYAVKKHGKNRVNIQTIN